MSEDEKGREGRKREECIMEATSENGKKIKRKEGEDDRFAEDGKRMKRK